MLNARTLFPPLFRPVDSGGGAEVKEKIAEIDSQITRIDSVITRLTDATMDEVEVGVAPNGDKLYRRVYTNLENIVAGKVLQSDTDVKDIYGVFGTIRAIGGETTGSSYPLPYPVNNPTTVYKGFNPSTNKLDLKILCSNAWNNEGNVYKADVGIFITKESEV